MKLYKLQEQDMDISETYLSSLEIAEKYNLQTRKGTISSGRAICAITSYLSRNNIDFEYIYVKGKNNALTKVFPSYIYEPAMKEFFKFNYRIDDLSDLENKGPFITYENIHKQGACYGGI